MIMIIMIMEEIIRSITTTKTMNKEIINIDQMYNNQTGQTDKMDHTFIKTDAKTSKIIKKGND